MLYDSEQITVKKPKDDIPLTPEQQDEWLKCADDIDYFLSNYVYTQGQKGRVLFKPRKYQKRFYDAIKNNDYVCLLAGRQTGKCSKGNSEITCRLNIKSLNTVVECDIEIESLHIYSKKHTTGEIQNGLQEWKFILENALYIRTVQVGISEEE